MNNTDKLGAVPFESDAGDSPIDVAVPFWITACVRLMPPRRKNGAEITASLANAVFPAVQALIADRLRTSEDAHAPLDRNRIARRCGLGDATKAGWLFDYLELIAFLRIRRHYAGVGKGRKSDTFTVFTRPPANYAGPHTHAELERALDDPDRRSTRVLFVGKAAGQPIDAGSGVYSGDQGAGSGVLVHKAAGQPIDAEFGVFSEGEREGTSLSGGSLPRLIERGTAAGGSPQGAIAAAVDAADADLETAVRSFPWCDRGWYPGESELLRLAAVMTRVRRRSGYTFDELVGHALRALKDPRGKSIGYVKGAFDDDRLPGRLLPVAYSLPSSPNVDHNSGVAGAEKLAEASNGPAGGDDANGQEIPPHCGECGNPSAGEANPAIRDVRHRIQPDFETGLSVPCVCHPDHSANQSATSAKEA